MTNEELVQLIQNGQTEYIPQLWDQVYRFICLMAKKRLIGEANYVKQMEDDLINETYFDFLKAVEGFKFDQEGKFITYLSYHLKNSFNRALGLRYGRDRNNPIRNSVSLDVPLEGTEDITLQDTIIDHMSEDDYRFIEDDSFWQDVHELLEEAIIAVMPDQMQEAYLVMLHENCIFAESCRRIGIPDDKQKNMQSRRGEDSRKVERYLRKRAWKKCQEIGIDEYFSIGLRGSGLSAYRRNGFTSSTERAAVRLVDGDTGYRKLVELMGL